MPDGQSLFGLTPEQIGGISQRRIAREAQAAQTVSQLSQIQQQRRAGEPVDVMIGEKTYPIPRGQLTEAIKLHNQMQNDRVARAKTEQEVAQLAALNTPVMINVSGKDYQVTQGMLKDMADSFKTFQQVGAREELRGVTPETLGQAPGFGAALVGAPGAAIAEIQRKAQAAGPGGLEERDRRQLAELQDRMILGVTSAPAEATPGNLQIINQNAKVLGQNTMYYPKVEQGFFGGETQKPQQVNLPVIGGIQVTPQNVEESAASRGISVFEELQRIEGLYGGGQ